MARRGSAVLTDTIRSRRAKIQVIIIVDRFKASMLDLAELFRKL